MNNSKVHITAVFAMLVASSVWTPVQANTGRLIYLDNSGPKSVESDDEIPVECKDDETIVYFGNGIANNKENALASTKVLADALHARIGNGSNSMFGDYRVASAFNKTSGSQVDPSFVRDYFYKVVPDIGLLDDIQARRWLANWQTAPDFIRKAYQNSLRSAQLDAVSKSAVATSHAQGYNDMLELGRRSVTLGHSHGTIVANLSFFGVNESLRQGHGVVAAALVENEVSGSDRFFGNTVPYVTIKEDGVVALFINAAPGKAELDANVNEYISVDDPVIFDGHNFNGWYMGGPSGRDKHQVDIPTGRTKKALIDWIVRTQSELIEKPCHGVSLNLGDSSSAYLGLDSTGVWRDYLSEPGVDAIAPINLVIPSLALENQTAMVDWKGRYISQEPTRVLSWQGPSSRYLNRALTASNAIYRDGRLAYVAPNAVVGAALQTDAKGIDWVVVATVAPSRNQVLFYRKNAREREGSDALFDANTNKGWNPIGSFAISGSLRYSPTSRYCDDHERAGNNPYTTDDLCMPGPKGWFAPYPAGKQKITMLRRYELSVPLGGNARVTQKEAEYGDQSLLASDYLDNDLLILRDVNIHPARGKLSNPDVGPSKGRWLTINDVDLTLPDMIDCDRFGEVCRPWRGTSFAAETGGWALHMDDGTVDGQTIHILSMDLRTESVFYSVKKSNVSTEYNLLHEGKIENLNTINGGPVEPFPSYGVSRYGYEGSTVNGLSISSYYDEVLGMTVYDAPKVNNLLGQYELLPKALSFNVARIPTRFGMTITTNKSLVLSSTFPDGTTVNYHSGAPAKRLDYLLGLDLTGTTVLPLVAQ